MSAPFKSFSLLCGSRCRWHSCYWASDPDPLRLSCHRCIGSAQWPLLGIQRPERKQVLNCVVIDRQRERGGSISGSDLLAVQIGYRQHAKCQRSLSPWDCTPRAAFRWEERQTSSVSKCGTISSNFKWKVREILCFKSHGCDSASMNYEDIETKSTFRLR